MVDKKTMSKEARKCCLEKGYYKNGECPYCGDYINDSGDCMNCDFHSTLINK